ncbi:MAG: ADP-ribosylation factor-like protein, partial [Candidatus Hodarchaeales archaeon]
MSSGNSSARRIAFVGLHSAGKTSTLRRLVHGEFTPPRGPTMGFNVDSFTYRGISVQAFDLGGQSPFIHTFWKSFIPRAEAIVFVIDSAKQDWFSKSRDSLEFCLGWAQSSPILIILANKQDLPESASIDELMQHFELEAIAEHDIRGLQLFATSAKTGQGIREAFDWLASQLVGDIELPKIHLHNIYVYRKSADISEHTGALNPLLNARIGGVKEDATLITGFYKAIEAFASQIGGKGIRTLVVENPGSEDYRFTQVEDDEKNLACLVVVNERDPEEAVENVAREALLVAREELDEANKREETLERIDERRLVSRIEQFIHIPEEKPEIKPEEIVEEVKPSVVEEPIPSVEPVPIEASKIPSEPSEPVLPVQPEPVPTESPTESIVDTTPPAEPEPVPTESPTESIVDTTPPAEPEPLKEPPKPSVTPPVKP